MTAGLTFVVIGKPRPKGSMKAVGKYGRGGMKEDNEESAPWREAVKLAARHAIRVHEEATGERWAPLDGPVVVDVVFSFDKPKGAPKTKRTYPITRSTYDLDKLVRNVFDAMTDARIWRDDSQAVKGNVEKTYCQEGSSTLSIPGAELTVRPFDP